MSVCYFALILNLYLQDVFEIIVNASDDMVLNITIYIKYFHNNKFLQMIFLLCYS